MNVRLATELNVLLSMIIFASLGSLTFTGIETLSKGLLKSLTVKEEDNVPFSDVLTDHSLIVLSTSKSAISLSRFFNWTGLTLKAPYLASLEIILSTTME